MRIILTFLLVLIIAPPANSQVFNAKKITLDNGLEVIILPNDRAPVVTHSVWFKVGAADEPPTKSGMAHYFEHLMFKGTETLAPGEFSKIIKQLGGNGNAFTSQDTTAYYQNIASTHLKRVMELEADRMNNLVVPAEHFASEKKVVLEERRQRTENNPRALFTEQMRSALFINHPYGTPVIGWMNEIESYDWDAVKGFYETWYAPNNAVVIISGDTTVEEAKILANETYGHLKPKEIPSKARGKVAPAIGETVMSLYDKTIKQPSFQSLYLAPSSNQNYSDSLALSVLNEILNGGPTTRLYKSLVVEQKKAVNVGFSYQSSALDYGSIWMSGTPAKDVSPQELKALILAEIQKVIDDGVTEKETQEAITRLTDSIIFARDSISGPAMIFGHAYMTGSTIEEIENWPTELSKVTPQNIKNVATQYINSQAPWIRPPVTGYLYPEKMGAPKTDVSKENMATSNKEGSAE